MFFAGESLLLGCGQNTTVSDYACGTVMVEAGDAKDVCGHLIVLVASAKLVGF